MIGSDRDNDSNQEVERGATDQSARGASPRSALAPGALLDSRYEVLDYLGEGGMGLVYKARDTALDEIVAIKVLRPQLLDDQLMRQRFLSEIKLARRVTHKNVCRIHDYGEDGPLGYISMQFVEGVELKTLARQSPGLSVAEAYDIAIQLTDGLAAIHAEGIIHRDFKSANVMVDARGDPRVMDFGIAKLWESSPASGLTTHGNITGTPEYMSPEQASGEPLDPRSDLYSMGIVLFELFTGTRPFTGDNLASLLYKQIYEAPPMDGDAAAAMPAAVKPIIQKALAKRPDDRFATAGELRDALLGARAALATTVSDTTRTIVARVEAVRGPLDEQPHDSTPSPAPPTPLPPSQPGRPRMISRRMLWSSLAAASVMIVAVIGASDLLRRASEREPKQPVGPAPAPASPATSASEPATKEVGLSERCAGGDAGACRTACDGGVVTACTQLGLLYNRGGVGLSRDLGAAALYYERGCNGGDLAGCNNLGTLYHFNALGLHSDRSKATGLYERACNGGHLEACANLGSLYLDEPGASAQQRVRARELLRKACSAGISRACARIGA